MLAHSFLIRSSSKLLVTRTGIKARKSLISGLWFPWPIYMFFEMRFDLGTLDSGERSLPFGLLVTISICFSSCDILRTVFKILYRRCFCFLGLIIICTLLGMATSRVGDAGRPFIQFFKATSDIVIQALRWLIWYVAHAALKSSWS